MATAEVKRVLADLRQQQRAASDKEIQALKQVTSALESVNREKKAALPNMQRGALVIHDQGRVNAAQDRVMRAYNAYEDASEALGVCNRRLMAFFHNHPEFTT